MHGSQSLNDGKIRVALSSACDAEKVARMVDACFLLRGGQPCPLIFIFSVLETLDFYIQLVTQ